MVTRFKDCYFSKRLRFFGALKLTKNVDPCKHYLSLHYNGSNNFLFVNATKIYPFKAKDSEIKPCLLCLANISKDLLANKIKNSQMNISPTFLLILMLLRPVILSISIISNKKS